MIPPKYNNTLKVINTDPRSSEATNLVKEKASMALTT
jgi:hypothetical protein